MKEIKQIEKAIKKLDKLSEQTLKLGASLEGDNLVFIGADIVLASIDLVQARSLLWDKWRQLDEEKRNSER